MKDQRGSWYLLTGIILGLALGLVYAWVVSPVQYVDAAPDSLRADFKDQYRALVAAAYLYSGNLERARVRLQQLGEADLARQLAAQAQRALAEGQPDAEVRSLGILALALGNDSVPQVTTVQPTILPTLFATSTVSPTPLISDGTPVPSPNTTEEAPSTTSQATNSILRTLPPTSTPLPTRTATPTPGAPFTLQELSLVCNPNLPGPLIQMQVLNAAGQPVPGFGVSVRWDGSEETVFTGLKPELGLGYADFSMIPGIIYSVQMSDGGEIVPNVAAAECEGEGGSRYWGSWLLIFVQP
jgi:hypothetical protein